MKPPPQPPSPPCNGCGATRDLSPIIHNVRHRANHRRFCTDCVLKQHPGLFCPICFQVYDDSPPPPHLRLICHKCPSIAHRSCVPASTGSDAPAPVFQCPRCADPKFSYFKLSSAVNPHGEGDPVVVSSQNGDRKSIAIDIESAKVLVAAARIAAASMSKAAAAARIDAERRAKEAAVARKKAREALEHLASLVAKEQDAKEVSTHKRSVSGSVQNDGLHMT